MTTAFPIDVDEYDALLDRLGDLDDLDDLQRTADGSFSDPAEANARIRDGYFNLSNAFGRLLHGDKPPENATFTTFAAWAAVSLRREVVRGEDDRADSLRPARRAYHWLATEVFDTDETIARNIVRGQAAIYQEISAAIYTMSHLVLGALPLDDDAGTRAGQWQAMWRNYTEELVKIRRALNDERDEAEVLGHGDVAVLQRAVAPYYQVLTEGLSSPALDHAQRKRRAELILLGTIRMLAYEQKRVQPVYERNFAYVPDALRELVAHRLAGRSTALVHLLREPSKRLLTFREILLETFQIAATRTVFSLVVGTEDVTFGRDIPVPPPANPLLRDHQPASDRARYGLGAFFPHDLADFSYRPTWAAWQRYNRSSGQGARTAVNNWLRYWERISFLVNLFRSRQQLSTLYSPPGSLPSTVPLPPAPLPSALEQLSDTTRTRLERVSGDGS
jgi:hypothetical protein